MSLDLPQRAKRVIRKHNDFDLLRSAAEELIATQSPEEVAAWKAHPLTQAKLMQWEADMYEAFVVWSNGGYLNEENSDVSLQRSLVAHGQVIALAQTLADIDETGVSDE